MRLPRFTVRFCGQLTIVLAFLSIGVGGLWSGGESVITGEIEYQSRQGRLLVIKRTEHPGPYWLLTSLIGGAGVICTPLSLYILKAVVVENRRMRSRVH